VWCNLHKNEETMSSVRFHELKSHHRVDAMQYTGSVAKNINSCKGWVCREAWHSVVVIVEMIVDGGAQECGGSHVKKTGNACEVCLKERWPDPVISSCRCDVAEEQNRRGEDGAGVDGHEHGVAET